MLIGIDQLSTLITGEFAWVNMLLILVIALLVVTLCAVWFAYKSILKHLDVLADDLFEVRIDLREKF